MTKELEAFENIMKVYGDTNSLEGTYNDFLTIKKALQRLEVIDNANPSEALKGLENLSWFKSIYDTELYVPDTKEFITIKQALLKAQERDFNYTIILIPFFDELVNVLGTNDIDEMLDKIKEQEKVLEIIKPLCEVVETPVKKYRYLKMNGVVVYTFKNEEEFHILKEVLCDE